VEGRKLVISTLKPANNFVGGLLTLVVPIGTLIVVLAWGWVTHRGR
jgi:sulfite exporter TauE/SafE